MNLTMGSRTLGQRGPSVTRLGLGMAALGRPGYINLGHGRDLSGTRRAQSHDVQAMQVHAFGVLDAAWQLGIRYFDAARSYGRAEQFLGNWLRQRGIDRDQVTVGSKWGYTYTAGWQVQAERHEIKDHSLSVLQRQWRETRDHLGTFVAIYQIHSATLESGVLADRAVHIELAHLKGEGIAVGLSLSGPNQAEVLHRALAIQVDGVPLFDTVQATWNLLEPSAGEALAAASQTGLGVIVKEALANGRLTERNQSPDFVDRLDLLRRQAERLDTSVDALALAAVVAQPWADVVLSGAASGAQIDSNVRALQVQWDDEAAHMLATLAEPAEGYWQARGRLAWN